MLCFMSSQFLSADIHCNQNRFDGDFRNNTNHNYADYKRFVSSRVSESVSFIGPALPPSHPSITFNASGWQAMVDRAPELLVTDLRNISSLINEKFFPNLTLAGRLARVANLKVFI